MVMDTLATPPEVTREVNRGRISWKLYCVRPRMWATELTVMVEEELPPSAVARTTIETLAELPASVQTWSSLTKLLTVTATVSPPITPEEG